ncbi:MAG: hypothetical protein ABEH65_10620 [Halobacteriales archaeon]
MTEALRIEAGERSADELLDRLQNGIRIVIEYEFLGNTHEITLRYDGDVYYCDTPTTLHRHRTQDGMRSCLESQGYCKS